MRPKTTLLIFLLWMASPAASQSSSFVNFESSQASPIAVSQDGQRLLALNTPDNRLAVFSLARPSLPILLFEIPVGLAPVSVRPRTEDEVWVVNWLSDSVNVVSLSRRMVVDTIHVKDEPYDVVFAGKNAFISVAASREVRVFDIQTRQQVAVLPIFGDEPRSMAVSPDGKTVWVAVHRSGNKTTIVPQDIAPPQPKPTNKRLPKPPQVGLIVSSEDQTWKPKINVNLPDHDLVEIDATTLKIRRNHTGIGTTLFGIAHRPGTQEVWVANTEARNLVRYEPNVRGHIVDNRVTRVITGSSPSVSVFDLNPNINYSVLPNPAALGTALAQPTDLTWDPSGKKLFVAAFGTDRIGILDNQGQVTGFVEVGNTSGATTDPRNKKGPRGLAHHPTSAHLYVLNRLANSISVVSTTSNRVLLEIALPDPTPPALKQGRGFLYDAKLSGNGTTACAGCHIDGDMDGLAWDLGDPGGTIFKAKPPIGPTFDLHPMKGPMVTQTLKGLGNGQPFHWRGDRPRLQDFNSAFASLMGKSPLSSTDMDAYAAFLQTIAFPPNPNLNLDRSLPDQPKGTSAADGLTFFTSIPFRDNVTCNQCHALPTGSNGTIIPGNVLQEPQGFAVPQLRNIYKKLGRRPTSQGRISGFGIAHEGSLNDVFDFLGLNVFSPLSTNTTRRTALQNFVLALDTGMAPLVGYQVTVNPTNVASATVTQDITLMMQRSAMGDINLIARGTIDGTLRGLLYDPVNGRFTTDKKGVGPFTITQLRSQVSNKKDEITFMGVPPGSGTRIGVDRDLDGNPNGEEGVLTYGTGTKGCNGTPRIEANSEPHIGNKLFAVVCDDAPAGAGGLLALSPKQASQSFLGVNVLVDLTSPGLLLVPVASDTTGLATLPVPIPNNSKLVGASAFLQVYWNDKCGSQGLAASNGLKVTITE